MFDRLRKMLTGGPAPEPKQEHERVQVATCVLLLEMAHADDEFHQMEELLIRDLLQQKFALSPECTAELIEFAQQQRQESLDLHQFARQINADFTIVEKEEVMEVVWRIVYADGVLDQHEDYLVRKIATLLRLSHRQMIAAKVRVLDEVRGRS
jgi:uncharacterized tellurite resistance protein B-like protein